MQVNTHATSRDEISRVHFTSFEISQIDQNFLYNYLVDKISVLLKN